MSRFCAIAFACVNIVTLLFCSSMIVLSFIRFLYGSLDKCLDANYSSTWKMSIVMAILSFVGLIGVLSRKKILLRFYIGVTIIICLVLVASFQIGFYTMHTAEGRTAEYVKGDEYKLDNFSQRARTIFLNRESWSNTKKCFKRKAICKSYVKGMNQMSSYEFRVLYPLQGCCKPPKECGYRQINETYWIVPDSGLKTEDNNCMLYKNNGEELCYDCDACKAAYVAIQLGDRFHLTIATLTWFIFCICCLIMACSTLKTIEKNLENELRAESNSSSVSPP